MVPVTGPVRTACTPFTGIAGEVVTTTLAVALATGQPKGQSCFALHAVRADAASAKALNIALMKASLSLGHQRTLRPVHHAGLQSMMLSYGHEPSQSPWRPRGVFDEPVDTHEERRRTRIGA
jgi:hypothetical protein